MLRLTRAARATRERGHPEPARGVFGSGSCGAFSSDSEQVRDASRGGRQALTPHVRPSIPGLAHSNVPVEFGARVDSPRSMYDLGLV